MPIRGPTAISKGSIGSAAHDAQGRLTQIVPVMLLPDPHRLCQLPGPFVRFRSGALRRSAIKLRPCHGCTARNSTAPAFPGCATVLMHQCIP